MRKQQVIKKDIPSQIKFDFKTNKNCFIEALLNRINQNRFYFQDAQDEIEAFYNYLESDIEDQSIMDRFYSAFFAIDSNDIRRVQCALNEATPFAVTNVRRFAYY